jgi:hypothetical protein
MKAGSAVEMTGSWKTRKTKPRFPFVSPGPWKSLRDSHIPTAPAVALFLSTENKSEKPKKGARQNAPLNFTPSGSSLD